MSSIAAVLRVAGVPLQIELVLGTMTGVAPGPLALALGLAIHLTVGTLFGLAYAVLFERVWAHGGAGTGMLLGVIHAAFFGVFIGFTPQFHPHVPGRVADPGPYFASAGTLGILAFFALHLLYGAIVGAGYGHVAAEREWAPFEALARRALRRKPSSDLARSTPG